MENQIENNMENEMETGGLDIWVVSRLYWGYIGQYRDNGKEHGNDYNAVT